MNSLMSGLVDKFNAGTGKNSARLLGDDSDSFRIAFSDENLMQQFAEFVKKATGKHIIIEPIDNVFGTGHLARIFFEKNDASRIADLLREYDKGTPVRGIHDEFEDE